MKKYFVIFILLNFVALQTKAQLIPTRIKDVYTVDTKGGKLFILNDTIQLNISKGKLEILNEYKQATEIKSNYILTFTDVIKPIITNKEVFLVTKLETTLNGDSLFFLSKLNLETKNLTQIPAHSSIFSNDNQVDINKWAFDDKLKDLYFTNRQRIIRYNIPTNTFSSIPFTIESYHTLYFADSGYVYIINERDRTKNTFLQSFHYLNPNDTKTYSEIDSQKNPDFITSDDGLKKYIVQKKLNYRINGNTLNQLPDSFLLYKLKGNVYGTNLRKGIVEIKDNKSNTSDTIKLNYMAVNDRPTENKLIITFDSRKKIADIPVSKPSVKNNTVASNTTDQFPYSISSFQTLLKNYAKEREFLFVHYNRYIKCLETGTRNSCDYHLTPDMKSRAQKQLNQSYEFIDLFNKYTSTFLNNITTDEKTTKLEFENDVNTLKRIINMK